MGYLAGYLAGLDQQIGPLVAQLLLRYSLIDQPLLRLPQQIFNLANNPNSLPDTVMLPLDKPPDPLTLLPQPANPNPNFLTLPNLPINLPLNAHTLLPNSLYPLPNLFGLLLPSPQPLTLLDNLILPFLAADLGLLQMAGIGC